MAQTVKNLPAMQKTRVLSLAGRIPWRREWLPTPVFLSGELHGQRTLVGCSPWGHSVGHNWVINTCISPLKKWRKFCTALKFALDYNFISIFSTLKSLTFWRNIAHILVLILYLTCSFLRIWTSQWSQNRDRDWKYIQAYSAEVQKYNWTKYGFICNSIQID